MRTFDPKEYVLKVKEAAQYIKNVSTITQRTFVKPEFSLTLGTGLSGLAKQIDDPVEIPYDNIPNFQKLTVPGHEGMLFLGRIAGVPIVCLSGRKHYYEVAQEFYGMMDVIFPVHVMAELGVKTYFSTNAVGALNMDYQIGDLVIIKDHNNVVSTIPDPLLGPYLNFGGNPTFQGLSATYDEELRSSFWEAAMEVCEMANVRKGIYTAVTGRSFETPAESLYLRKQGIDIVGMSVIPEAIVAKNRGMKVMAVSIVTDKANEEGTNAVSHDKVMAILESDAVANRLTSVFSKFFELYRHTTKQIKPASAS
jgi:purine-nucleoside phosphorylase